MRVWCAKADVVSMPVINQYARDVGLGRSVKACIFTLSENIFYLRPPSRVAVEEHELLSPHSLSSSRRSISENRIKTYTRYPCLRARVSHAAPDDRNDNISSS